MAQFNICRAISCGNLHLPLAATTKFITLVEKTFFFVLKCVVIETKAVNVDVLLIKGLLLFAQPLVN